MRKVASRKRRNAAGRGCMHACIHGCIHTRDIGYAKNRECNAPLVAGRANNNPCGNNYRDLCYLQM